MTSKNIATIILKKKSGFEIENITRTVELDYYNHNSFDGEISWDGVALIMRNDAHEALKQIEHKEK